MNSVNFLSTTLGMVIASVAAVVALCATIFGLFKWAKNPWRWLAAASLALAAVLISVFCWRQSRTPADLDLRLPAAFRNRFWLMIWGFGIASIASLALVGRRTTAWVRPAVGEGNGNGAADDEGVGPAKDGAIEGAWETIRGRMIQGRVDLAQQPFHLLIAPDELNTQALVRAADLPVFVHVPEYDAPLHADAVAEGVLLSVAGASSLRTGAVPSSERREMDDVAALLLAERPDRPLARTVAILFPYEWLALPDAPQRAAAARDDLQALARTLKVRCPVLVLFTGMEEVSGFLEFVSRLQPPQRQGRCGFAIPRTLEYSDQVSQKGLAWMSGWFHAWSLNLLAEDLLNMPSNIRLWRLGHEFRRLRKRMRDVLDAAFSTHPDAEPVLLRGCYFAATGEIPRERAFIAGLLKGPKGRIFAEGNLADWSLAAHEADRRYRRAAWLLGLVGGGLSLMAWIGIQRIHPGFWIGIPVLALAWIAVIVMLVRRVGRAVAG